MKILLWIILFATADVEIRSNDDIGEGIQLIEAPANVSVPEGSNVIFKCLIRGPILYKLWWYRPWNDTESTEVILCHFVDNKPDCRIHDSFSKEKEFGYDEMGNLLVTGVQRKNHGVYECQGYSDTSSANPHAYLNVLIPPAQPVVRHNHSQEDFYAGKRVEFHCLTNESNPPPFFQWILVYSTATIARNPKLTANVTLKEEDFNVSLNQNARSPYPSYTSNFSIELMKEHHLAQLICLVRNSIGEPRKVTTVLKVKYSPHIEHDASNDVIVTEGDVLNMPCAAHGYPQPKIIWLNEHNHLLSEHMDLRFAQMSRNDSGRYTCIARNELGEKNATFQVIVQYPPVITLPESVTVPEGGQISIPCSSFAQPQPHQVDWISVSEEENGTTQRSWVKFNITGIYLMIQTVQRSHAGLYVCSVENRLHPNAGTNRGKVTNASSNKSLRLIVQYKPHPPKATLYPSTVLQVGEPFHISCLPNRSDPGLPSPQLEVIRSNSGGLVVAKNGSFIAKSVHSSHRGCYQCQARNSIGSSLSSKVCLEVDEPPRLVADSLPANMSVKISQISFRVKCVMEGSPAPKIEWFHNNKLISPVATTVHKNVVEGRRTGDKFTIIDSVRQHWGSLTRVTSELLWTGTSRGGNMRDRLTPEDAGLYRCTGGNRRGSATANMELTILFAPVIIEHVPKVATFMSAPKIILSCVVKSQPASSFHWEYDGTTLPSNNSTKYKQSRKVLVQSDHSTASKFEITAGFLEIQKIEKSDLGHYTCLVQNKEGRTAEIVELVQQSSPEAPKNVKVISSTWESIEITWVEGFHGGDESASFRVSITSTDHSLFPMGPRIVETSDKRYNITGLLPKTNYSIIVWGKNRFGSGQHSSVLHFVTPYLNIPPVKGVHLSKNDQKLYFQAPANYCVKVEQKLKHNKDWLVFRHCVDPQSNFVFISENNSDKSSAHLPAMLADQQSATLPLYLRISACLHQRVDVCSEPVVVDTSEEQTDIPFYIILIVTCVCAGTIVVLMILLFYFCCRRSRSEANILHRSFITTPEGLQPCKLQYSDLNDPCMQYFSGGILHKPLEGYYHASMNDIFTQGDFETALLSPYKDTDGAGPGPVPGTFITSPLYRIVPSPNDGSVALSTNAFNTGSLGRPFKPSHKLIPQNVMFQQPPPCYGKGVFALPPERYMNSSRQIIHRPHQLLVDESHTMMHSPSGNDTIRLQSSFFTSNPSPPHSLLVDRQPCPPSSFSVQTTLPSSSPSSLATDKITVDMESDNHPGKQASLTSTQDDSSATHCTEKTNATTHSPSVPSENEDYPGRKHSIDSKKVMLEAVV